MTDQTADKYYVVINEEEQYSIWRAGGEIPAGWRAVGEQSSREECLAFIEDNWTDMRPRSVRQAMS